MGKTWKDKDAWSRKNGKRREQNLRLQRSLHAASNPTAVRPRIIAGIHLRLRSRWPDLRCSRIRDLPFCAFPGCGPAITVLRHWFDTEGQIYWGDVKRSDHGTSRHGDG